MNIKDYHKLIEMYSRNEIITIDIVSWKEYNAGKKKTLEHFVDGKWVKFVPPVRDYGYYLHGLNPEKMHISRCR